MQRWKLRTLLWTLVLSMGVLLIGISWLYQQQWRQVEASMVQGRSTHAWNFFQFELEHLRLRQQLDTALNAEQPQQHMGALGLRYQIFASRFDLIREGSSAATLAHHVEFAPLVRLFTDLLQRYDPYLGDEENVPAFDRQRLHTFQNAMNESAGPVQALLLASVDGQNRQTTEHFMVIRELLLNTSLSSALLALVASAFGWLAVRQLRISRGRLRALQALHHEVTHRATHDALTGLLNREEFDRRLRAALQASQQEGVEHAVLFIDLDRFKVVNDTSGHLAGDQLLREVATLLAKPIRASDALARLGGDEFGVILPHCSVERAQALGAEICAKVDAYRFAHGMQRYHIGSSIGLVMVHGQWPSATAVLQAADSACYVAKSTGRNRVHLYRESDQDLQAYRSHMQWIQRLESALENQKLRLYWQRIVPLQPHRQVEGLKAEVLLRLLDDGDMVSAGVFLPAIERYGLATRVDRWVVTAVLDWMQRHRDVLHGVSALSVNLSGQSVSDPEFHRDVLQQLQDSELPCHKLVFEITETTAITHLGRSRAFIDALAQLGVKVALDDFGSGMSSFGYLKKLPVDYLKIDGQFMRQLETDQYDQVTVRAICAVARSTGKATVAEWIDRPATADMLRQFGVDYGQGYLWHQPESMDTLHTAIRRGLPTPSLARS